ncbi:hypothetical protein [Bacillus sp. CECT 9360]|nr:hypothetical protein [Bacillus sp. CECT 9360]CAH0346672.1 hypothetical protein BCI9360_03017 [Bacillus sp. CECT 9360]
MLFVGIAILIVLFVSTTTLEKTLKSIEKQNTRVIELLEDIRNEK